MWHLRGVPTAVRCAWFSSENLSYLFRSQQCFGSMFSLSLIEHKFPLPPHLLGLPREQAVKQELERLFLDKVIPNLGLCISIYDIQKIEGGFIVPGDGAATYEVTFRLVLFRPFVGEVLIGKIAKSGPNGLQVSLGFFNDIHVPVHLLRQPYRIGPLPGAMVSGAWNVQKFYGSNASTEGEESGIWIWKFEGEELFLDLDEEISFRVQSVKYPPIPIERGKDNEPFAPMEVIGSIADDGLGLLSWWE